VHRVPGKLWRKVEFKLNFILRPGDTAQGWLEEKNVEEKLEK
jgi:hypothetical protein